MTVLAGPGMARPRPPLQGVRIHNDPVGFCTVRIERLWHIKLSRAWWEITAVSQHLRFKRFKHGRGRGERGCRVRWTREEGRHGGEGVAKGSPHGSAAWFMCPATRHFCYYGLVVVLLTNTTVKVGAALQHNSAHGKLQPLWFLTLEI